MDEHQTIIALGAGGISKAYYDDGNRLERVPNVSNFEVYIQRIDEMIQRKDEKLYLPFEYGLNGALYWNLDRENAQNLTVLNCYLN